jgi:hypothetical protein
VVVWSQLGIYKAIGSEIKKEFRLFQVKSARSRIELVVLLELKSKDF